MDKKKDQARLRLATRNGSVVDFDEGPGKQRSRYSASSFNAACPLGSVVLPCSMSLTEDGDKPMSAPISESFSCLPRSSEIIDFHGVMPPSLRAAVTISQRLPVTAVRENTAMARPPNLPRYSSIGPRVRWWRNYRKITRKELAKLADISYSTLSDLENDRQEATRQLHLIAAALRLNPHYLETDKGEPEADTPQEPPPVGDSWPFQRVSLHSVSRLTHIERKFAEMALAEAIQEIEEERRRARKSG